MKKDIIKMYFCALVGKIFLRILIKRKETFDESILIEKYLKSTYEDFGYDIIEIPKDDIKKRVDFILKAL